MFVVGGGCVGRGLATRLKNRGENVVIIDNDQDAVETARSAGFSVQLGDGTDIDVLGAAGIENAKIVAAVTADDDTNLLVAQLTNSRFDVERVISRVNTPENVEAFEELGVQSISANDAVAHEMDNAIERTALSEWMTELGRTGDVQEVKVTAEGFIGELETALPDGVLVALVSRTGESQIPDSTLLLEHGDHFPFVGRRDAVH